MAKQASVESPTKVARSSGYQPSDQTSRSARAWPSARRVARIVPSVAYCDAQKLQPKLTKYRTTTVPCIATSERPSL